MRRAAGLLWLLASCSAVEITPAAIRADQPQTEAHLDALARWERAVDIANDFLASEARVTLPSSSLVLHDDGLCYRWMREDGSGVERSIEIWNTSWGDLVLDFGFQAQERSFGFVVGTVGVGPELLAHSWFRHASGEEMDPASMAALLLHEITHVHFEDGTVGFWNGLGYYLEVIFTFSTVVHSAEERPYATTREFLGWYANLD